MRLDKEKAEYLRKQGKSYKEIRKELKIPLSTLSDWFSREEWSAKIKEELEKASQEGKSTRLRELGKVRGEHLRRIYEEAREEARQEFESLRYDPLFVAGMMLFWGEGTKTVRNQVRVSNSDPEMIRLYVYFLRGVCGLPVEKIKIAVLAYPDLDDASIRRFWSFVSGVPLSQFHKTMVIQGRHKTRRLGNGVCTVIVLSAYFKVKMLEWLSILTKELMKKGNYENI